MLTSQKAINQTTSMTITLSNQRNLPLDVLRGLTVALMIIVNNPGSWGSIYAPFRHAEWHGFTLTDLVFPTFLFVVGNALSFTWRKSIEAGSVIFLKKVIKRAVLIFLIGFLLNYFPFYEMQDGKLIFVSVFDVRIWGVLQRIALCYLLANIIIYYTPKIWMVFGSVFLLILYWAILHFYGNTNSPYTLEGNAVKDLDVLLLPTKNLYQGFGIPFEPEGLLSTLSAIVNVLAGYLVGGFVQTTEKKSLLAIKLLGLGVLFLIIAKIWNIYFPINKPIWTSSYVVFTVGWDLLILGVLIYIIDVINLKSWGQFFVPFGKNPLFIYIVSWIVIKILYLIPLVDNSLAGYIYHTLFQQWMEEKTASLAFALSYMLLMWLICFLMDRKKIYVRV